MSTHQSCARWRHVLEHTYFVRVHWNCPQANLVNYKQSRTTTMLFSTLLSSLSHMLNAS